MGTFTTDTRVFAPRHVLGWLTFTMAAGVVNAATVLACDNFVSHVTGSVTNVAIDTSLTRLFLVAVGTFISGAMLAVLIAETFRKRPAVAFALPILVAIVLLVMISIAGKANLFGAFGATREAQRTLPMLGLLGVSMGLVNASVAAATKNRIRITHFTGPVTDLAGNIVRAALGTGSGAASELRWAALRFSKLVSFVIGAAIAANAAPKIQFDVFAIAAVVLAVALGFTVAPESEEATQGECEAPRPSAFP